MTKSLHIFLILSTITLSSGSYSEIAEKCCMKGKAWFRTSKEVCPASREALRDIPSKDRDFCRSTIDVCCLLSRKKKQCLNGIMIANARNDCSSLNNRVGRDQTRECCQCCYIGRQTALHTSSCSLPLRIMDLPCQNTFMHCCNKTLSPGSTAKIIRELPKGGMDKPCPQCEHSCFRNPGTKAIKCTCRMGYYLDTDGTSCKDIDECTQKNICSPFQNCENNVGSYVCKNIQNDKPSEISFSENNGDGVDGNNSNTNNGNNDSDDNNNNRGHNRNNKDEYNDKSRERGTSNDNNGGINMKNKRKGSEITTEDIRMCGYGYKYNKEDTHCEDVNECADHTDTCMEGQTCENTLGSYVCRRSMSCGTGYTLDQRSQLCLDDDECKQQTHDCGSAYDCVNIPGSFRCVQKDCRKGYRLDFRTGNCNPIRCLPGMKPDDTGNCVDVNECIETPQVCRRDQECKNTIGSYECKKKLNCSKGFKKSSDGNECLDINECKTNDHDCFGHMMQCRNLPGSYMCQCQKGFVINQVRKICEDVDECREFNTCAKNQKCENTFGSFRCLCKEGFQINGTGCTDIDECSRPGMCQHECVNTQGSFQCYCREGFKISSDKRTCEDIDECKEASLSGLQLCVGKCENTLGSFKCTCPDGFTLDTDKRTCLDINECTTGRAQCHRPNHECFNTRGGYKCQDLTCPKGFHGTSLDHQNSMKCLRKYSLCPQGDHECLYAPVYYSFSLITFPTSYTANNNLFALRLPVNQNRRFEPVLEFIKAVNPYNGYTSVDSSFFELQTGNDRVVLELKQKINEAQDIELQVKLNIYSREFEYQSKETFFGTAIIRVLLYVTHDPW